MKYHFECQPMVWHETPLVFDWEPETGEVTGPSAEQILEAAKSKYVSIHPVPASWGLSAEPTKNWTDMAAIVGYWHILPPELMEHYPQLDYEYDEGVVY